MHGRTKRFFIIFGSDQKVEMENKPGMRYSMMRFFDAVDCWFSFLLT